LDADKIVYPLQLRKWNPGDIFYPFGMTKRKKISDFFIDLKISKFDKQNTWILTSNNEIVWVVGMRIDNRFAVTDDTKNILQIEFKQ
jgi:tRNA(Ile)-lysidine synthase